MAIEQRHVNSAMFLMRQGRSVDQTIQALFDNFPDLGRADAFAAAQFARQAQQAGRVLLDPQQFGRLLAGDIPVVPGTAGTTTEATILVPVNSRERGAGFRTIRVTLEEGATAADLSAAVEETARQMMSADKYQGFSILPTGSYEVASIVRR